MRTTDALVDFLASPQPTTRWTVDPRGQIATSNEVSIYLAMGRWVEQFGTRRPLFQRLAVCTINIWLHILSFPHAAIINSPS